MIDKRVPRILNSSNDNRIKKKEEFNDALNIRVNEDYGGFPDAVDDAQGNAGVIKPVEGNQAFATGQQFQDIGTTRVVGTVPDHRAGVVYFFVASEDPDDIGVYAADTTNFFGQGVNVQVPIYENPALSFDSNTFVRGEVVYIYDESPDRDFKPVLYFTDNINEPRRIDVFRALEIGLEYSDQTDLFNATDFICACPKTPMAPPTFEFFTDLNRSVSEFRSANGFQFAYQCLYITGEETALSTFSKLAVPPVYTTQGANLNQNLNSDNGIRITIPRILIEGPILAETADIFNFSDEINQVRILCREGDSGQWLVIDEVDVPADNQDIVYEFFNDRVFSGIPIEEQEKQFDSLPRAAEALAVVEDRLFYGNYLEGYNNPDINANLTVSYQGRPQDFIEVDIVVRPRILPLTNVFDTTDLTPNDLGGDRVVNRVAGYEIDCSNITGEIPAGSILNFSLRVNPAKNWHIYNSENSYHTHRRAGIDSVASVTTTVNSSYLPNGDFPRLPLIAANAGVSNRDVADLQWTTFDSPNSTQVDQTINVKLGTSAGAPLVLQGKPIEFSFSVGITNNIAAGTAGVTVKNIINAALQGDDVSQYGEYIGQPITEDGYLISVPLSFDQVHDTDEFAPEDQPKYAVIDPTTAAGLQAANLIIPLHEDVDTTGTTGYMPPAPCGYVMIRSADVRFALRHMANLEALYTGPNSESTTFFTLDLTRLNIQGAYDSENPGIVTCVPFSQSPALDNGTQLRLREWRVYKRYDLVNGSGLRMFEGAGLNADLNNINRLLSIGVLDDAVPVLNPHLNVFFYGCGGPAEQDIPVSWESQFENTTTDTTSALNRGRMIGGLIYQQNGAEDNFSNNIYTRRTDFPTVGVTLYGEELDLYNKGYSIVDGQGGLQNFRRSIEIDVVEPSFLESVVDFLLGGPADNVDQQDITFGEFSTANEQGPYDFVQIMFGAAASTQGGIVGVGDANALYPFELIESFGLQLYVRVFQNAPTYSRFGLDFDPNNTSYLGAAFSTEPNAQAEVDILNYNAYFSEGEDGDIVRSFKTSANHALGIVYYDERGRSGPVAPLPSRENPSVYVAGYSNQERDIQGLQGRAEIVITMNTAPPDWAFSYQFVYAGNSTYSDFIQYSAGGAFVSTDDESENPSIYVSLNYLQENTDVSYAEAWGAVDYNGDRRFYQFVPGDYLRILSYNIDENNRVWPNNYTFEVIDAVTLPNNIEANPLATGIFADEGAGVAPARVGSFIVLRDNPNANGFTAADVTSGALFTDSNTHYWNNRTIVEIVRPRKNVDAENLVYYEIGEQYSVGRDSLTGNLYHQFNQHVIRDGDVWWRRVPTNIAPYNEDQAVFTNLIQEEDPESLLSNAPRFRDVYLESMTFNDSFSGNRQLGRGKPKLVGAQNQEIRRFSSITFSDINDYSTPINRFTSFNAYNAPFKDLPNEFGNINFILNYNGSLFVLQEDKASQLPINRDIITTATGQDSLTVTNKVIGAQIMYAGSYGTDNHPESVVRVDNNIYFAHAGRGEAYKFNPSSGISVISMRGMASMIRDAFNDAIAAGEPWVLSGYDPLNDEYLLTITNLNPFNNFVIAYDQPNFDIGDSNIPTSIVPDILIDTGGGEIDVFDGAFDDPVNPSETDGVVDLIDTTWDEIIEDFGNYNDWLDEVINNGVLVNDPPADILTNWDGNNELDVSGYISTELANYVGDRPIAANPGGIGSTVVGNFDSQRRVIVTTPSYSDAINGNVGVAGTIAWNLIKGGGIVIPTNFTYELLWTTNIPLSLGQHMEVAYTSELNNVSSLMNYIRVQGDTALDNATNNISNEAKSLVALLQDQANGNPSLLAFASDIDSAVIVFDNVTGEYTYSSTEVNETDSNGVSYAYPLGYGIEYKETLRGGPFDAWLSAVKAAAQTLNAVATSLNPNDLTDVQGVYNNLTARIANLTTELNIVTDQLEETSSVPTVLDPNASPLIANVESGGNNFITRGALAQSTGVIDRELTQSDVLASSQMAQALEFLSGNGVEITAELVESIANNFIADFSERVKLANLQSIIYIDNPYESPDATPIERIENALFSTLAGDSNLDGSINLDDILGIGADADIITQITADRFSDPYYNSLPVSNDAEFRIGLELVNNILLDPVLAGIAFSGGQYTSEQLLPVFTPAVVKALNVSAEVGQELTTVSNVTPYTARINAGLFEAFSFFSQITNFGGLGGYKGMLSTGFLTLDNASKFVDPEYQAQNIKRTNAQTFQDIADLYNNA